MISPIIIRPARRGASGDATLMRFFEDIEIGQRRELGSFTFTAEDIKRFARQFDPQRFHLSEEEGRNSLFGGLAASGWHVASVCMKMIVADGPARRPRSGRARREGRDMGTFAGLSRTALDQAGARRRHASASRATIETRRTSDSRPEWGIVQIRNAAPTSAANLRSRFSAAAFVPRRNARCLTAKQGYRAFSVPRSDSAEQLCR